MTTRNQQVVYFFRWCQRWADPNRDWYFNHDLSIILIFDLHYTDSIQQIAISIEIWFEI